MRALVVAACMAAVPASADSPTFRIGIACEGPLPAVIQIEALRPGVTMLTLEELMSFCVNATPEKSRWRIGA